MAKKHNLSDMFIDQAYTDKDANDNYMFGVGKVLKFDYEGSPTTIRVTRIDRKNHRMWGEEITLYDFNTGMSHYGHDVDATDAARIYCKDCDVEIDQPATEEGEVKSIERQILVNAEEEAKDEIRDKHRRFRYELLKQDGTIKHFDAGKRKKLGEMYKILGCQQVHVVPGAFFTEKYAGKAVGYQDAETTLNPFAEANPLFKRVPGEADEEVEFYEVSGDVLMEIEVFKS